MPTTDTKKDVSSILLEGTGTPYIAIFDGSSNPIIDPSNQLPLGTFIDNFIYEYNEEKEDTGSFVITTNNPNICDLPQLQYQEILWIQWGYVLPDSTVVCGNPRRVMITDISASFKSSGVTLEIKFADPNILLKNIPANYFARYARYLNGVLNAMTGRLSTPVIKIYPSHKSDTGYLLLEKQGNDGNLDSKANKGQEVTVISKAEGTYEGPIISAPGKEVDRTMYQAQPQPASEVQEDAVYAKAILLDREEAFSEKITELIKDTDNYKLINTNLSTQGGENKLFGKQYNSIVVTSSGSTYNNVWGQLKNLGKSLPNGPFYMDARDGQLVLHNKKVDRPVFLKYTWNGGNGELLDFGVNSKFIRSIKEISTAADIDPTSKTLSSTTVQGIADKSMVNSDIYFVGWDDSTDKKPDINNSGLYTSEELGKLKAATGTVTDKPSNYGLIPKTKSSDPTAVISDTQTTLQEQQQWVSKNMATFNSIQNPSTQGQLSEAITNMTNIFSLNEPLQTNRPKYTTVTAYSKEEAVAEAKKKLGDLPFEVTGSKPVQPANTKLYNTPGVDNSTNLVSGTSNYQTLYSWDIMYKAPVTIDGRDVVNNITDWTSLVQANDIQETISNQVKATAIVLGRPSIETSMNIEISGVSKFSGIWYTKVVKHIINTSNGYTTEIEFVPRNTVVSSTIITARQALGPFSDQINREKKSIKNGNYKYAEREFIGQVIESLESYPKFYDKSVWATINPETGTVEVKSTEDSFNSGVLDMNALKS